MKHVSRGERLSQIKEICEQSEVTLSTRQLAEKMGMAFSPHSRNLIYEAYKLEMIDGLAARNPKGIETFYWFSKKNRTYVQTSLGL